MWGWSRRPATYFDRSPVCLSPGRSLLAHSPLFGSALRVYPKQVFVGVWELSPVEMSVQSGEFCALAPPLLSQIYQLNDERLMNARPLPLLVFFWEQYLSGVFLFRVFLWPFASAAIPSSAEQFLYSSALLVAYSSPSLPSSVSLVELWFSLTRSIRSETFSTVVHSELSAWGVSRVPFWLPASFWVLFANGLFSSRSHRVLFELFHRISNLDFWCFVTP